MLLSLALPLLILQALFTGATPTTHHKRWFGVQPLTDKISKGPFGPWPPICNGQSVCYCFTDARSQANLEPIVNQVVAKWVHAFLNPPKDHSGQWRNPSLHRPCHSRRRPRNFRPHERQQQKVEPWSRLPNRQRQRRLRLRLRRPGAPPSRFLPLRSRRQERNRGSRRTSHDSRARSRHRLATRARSE